MKQSGGGVGRNELNDIKSEYEQLEFFELDENGDFSAIIFEDFREMLTKQKILRILDSQDVSLKKTKQILSLHERLSEMDSKGFQ